MDIYVKSVAIRLAKQYGLINLTQEKLSRACGFPVGSFYHTAGCSFKELLDVLKLELNAPATTVTKRRADPELRKKQLLDVAVMLAQSNGCKNLTHHMVSVEANVSKSLVLKYFPTILDLRDSVMEEAVTRPVEVILLEGILDCNPIALRAPEKTKKQAKKHLTGL